MDGIIIGNKKVIAHGSFITFRNEPTKLKFKVKSEDYTFEFHLFSTENKKPEFKVVGVNDHTVRLEFYNFDSLFSTSNIDPARIGDIDKAPLYMNTRITKCSNKSENKLVEYTFYLEEKTND